MVSSVDLLDIIREEHASYWTLFAENNSPIDPFDALSTMPQEVRETYGIFVRSCSRTFGYGDLFSFEACYCDIFHHEITFALHLLERGYVREAEIEWEIADILLRSLPRRSHHPEEATVAHALVMFGQAKIHVKKRARKPILREFGQAAQLFEAAAAISGEDEKSDYYYLAGLCFEGMGDHLLSEQRIDLAYERFEDAISNIRRASERNRYYARGTLFKKTAEVLRLLDRPQEAAKYLAEGRSMLDGGAFKYLEYWGPAEDIVTDTENAGNGGQLLAESKNVLAFEGFLRRGSLAPVGRETDVTADLPKKPAKLFVARNPGKKSPSQQAAADLEVINFIKEVYGPYLVEHRAKLLAYIREHDPALTNAIAVLKRNKRLPPEVYIPSRTEALEELVQKAAKGGLKSLSKPERRSIRGAISRRRKPSPG